MAAPSQAGPIVADQEAFSRLFEAVQSGENSKPARIPIPEELTALQRLALVGDRHQIRKVYRTRKALMHALEDAFGVCVTDSVQFNWLRIDLTVDMAISEWDRKFQIIPVQKRIRGGPIPRKMLDCIEETFKGTIFLRAEDQNLAMEFEPTFFSRERQTVGLRPRPASAAPAPSL
jgi:hypothetical protein